MHKRCIINTKMYGDGIPAVMLILKENGYTDDSIRLLLQVVVKRNAKSCSANTDLLFQVSFRLLVFDQIGFAYRHSIGHEYVGVDDRSKLVQKVRSLFKQISSGFLHAFLKQACSRPWHSIPSLWLTPTDTAFRNGSTQGRADSSLGHINPGANTPP